MKRLLYALLAAGMVFVSCGFVLAERHPDAVKAPYPPKVDLEGSQGAIRGVAEAEEKTQAEERAVPAVRLTPAQPVKNVKMTSDRL